MVRQLFFFVLFSCVMVLTQFGRCLERKAVKLSMESQSQISFACILGLLFCGSRYIFRVPGVGIHQLVETRYAAVDAHASIWIEPPRTAGNGAEGSEAEALDASAEALIAAMDAAGVEAALLVQPMAAGFDHSYISTTAAGSPRLRYLLLADPSRAPNEASDALAKVARTEAGLAGVRFDPQLWPVAVRRGDWLADATGRALFAQCAGLRLAVSVDARNLASIAPSLENLMDEVPAVAVFLDHWLPDADEAWAQALTLGVKFPQLHLDVSPLFSESRPPEDRDSRMHELLRIYGPGRLLWGCEFPMPRLRYDAALDSARRWLQRLPGDHAQLILSGTTKRLFFRARPSR
ncbi:hypothetical protein M885DRAFT_528130 [Pelagophyceae sp. CCMP2097]|nr:hypothetical protein M885DRAFT_528130 [Pelagophyceae sp. CCMP2097]